MIQFNLIASSEMEAIKALGIFNVPAKRLQTKWSASGVLSVTIKNPTEFDMLYSQMLLSM